MASSSSSVGAPEIARGVNVFLGFSSSDQQALLEAIEDYCTSSDNADDLEDDQLHARSVQTTWKVQ